MLYRLSFNKKTAFLILVAGPLAAALIFLAGYRTGLDRGFRRAQAELSRQQESHQRPSGLAGSQVSVETGSSLSKAPESAESQSTADASHPAPSGPAQPGGPITSKEGFTVQIGAYQSEDPARELKDKFSARGYSAFIFQGRDAAGEAWYAVRIGHFKDLEPATRAAVTFTMREKLPAHVRPLNEL